MFKSYLTTALRHFSRNKFHSLINILGLGLGIMVSILALMFMLDEASFDTFHSKADRLYRLNKERIDETGDVTLNAESSGLYGPGIKEVFPEVENYMRYQPWFDEVVLSYEGKHLQVDEQEIVIVDDTFFDVFDFELTRGDKNKVLTRPATMVLTEDLAASLFGAADPIGKSVVGINGFEFEITGIAKEAPRNSHIQYKALVSYASTVPQLGPLNYEWMNNWHTQGITTYILLRDGADPKPLTAKLADFTTEHIPARADQYHFYLQPFKEVYLHANEVVFHRMAKTGNQQYVYFFGLIAAFILFIACVNYINISTSKSTKRSREVGMRKTLGARKQQLIHQFLGESLVITVLSGVFAMLMLYMAVPLFNDLAGKTLDINLLFKKEILGAFMLLIIFVSVIAGGYPAFVLSAFKPSEVFKPSARSLTQGNWQRQVLITFQLVISVTMISGTLIVFEQLDYIISRDLGFDKEHTMVVPLTSGMVSKGEVIQQEVNTHSSVLSTSLTRIALGSGSASTFVQPEGFPPDQIEIRMFPIDFNFKETYGLEMAMGRFFDPKIASDSNAVVINETMVNLLEWTDPIQKTIKFQDDPVAYPVIGVVKDFNYRSLYSQIEPVVMYQSVRNRRNLSIRFSGSPADLLASLEATWKKYEDRYPFQYYFVDEEFAKMYSSENKLFQTVMTFAALSIVIACLGLYGLVSFTIEQRTKEFGIRKIFGATVAGLNFLVNRKFILLVILAGVISTPLVMYYAKGWLKTFAYHIEPGVSTFMLAILLTMSVTLLAVSIQAIRAARMSPSAALRYE
ncbi:MAG TPA: ABC transporter permease [Cyclobacteriaceae bacterium]|nr:ABC transporter permease [Cyclobacteriaceae bacterium]